MSAQRMNWLRAARLGSGVLALVLSASLSFAATPAPKNAKKQANSVKSDSKPANAAHHSSKKSRKTRARGQKNIDADRARQIQEALFREHYMSGSPTGKWDDTTQQAMRHYQAAQGWQSKSVPDSRALIRLGLGPDHGRLLNPESAMTTEPQLPHGTPAVASSRGRTSSGVSSTLPGALPGQGAKAVAAPASTLASPAR
jgi:peptidoglycan hydrolase-like protein with peptidoglycan-binding domain